MDLRSQEVVGASSGGRGDIIVPDSPVFASQDGQSGDRTAESPVANAAAKNLFENLDKKALLREARKVLRRSFEALDAMKEEYRSAWTEDDLVAIMWVCLLDSTGIVKQMSMRLKEVMRKKKKTSEKSTEAIVSMSEKETQVEKTECLSTCSTMIMKKSEGCLTGGAGPDLKLDLDRRIDKRIES